MATKKVQSTKKTSTKTTVSKSKKPSKNIKAKVMLARLNINIPKSLHNKIKQLSLKNKTTIQEIVAVAIKKYINKPVLVKTSPNNAIAV